MERLDEALKMIDSLRGDEPLEYIKKTLLEAYALDNDCLDAMTLYSRSLYDTDKEGLLSKILDDRSDIDTRKDDIMTRQYMRMLYELYNTYKDQGKLPLALKLARKIYSMKGDIFDIESEIYALEAYFDKEHSVTCTKDVCLLIDIIYDYERSIPCFSKVAALKKTMTALDDILDDKEADDEEHFRTAELLRKYAYYINRVPGVISYLRKSDV